MKGTKLPLYALMTLLSSSPTLEEANALSVYTPHAQSIEVPLNNSIFPAPFVQLPEDPDATSIWYTLPTQDFMVLQSVDGAQLFCTAQEVEQFQQKGGTLEEAQAAALVLTSLNNSLHRVCDKPGFSLYKVNDGKLEDIVDLLKITEDGTDQTDSIFKTWEDVVLYKASGGDIPFAQELASIVNGDGSPLFATPQDYASAALMRKDKKISTDAIRKLHAIKDESGKEVFTTARELLPVLGGVLQQSTTLDAFISFSEIKTPDGRPLFKTADDYSRAAYNVVTKDQLAALAKLKNRKGDPLFTRGADAVQYARAGKDDSYLIELLGIRNAAGEQIFSNGSYLAPFAQMLGNPTDAKSLADLVDADNKPVLKPYQVVRYAALGYNADTLFHEVQTNKPNMLLLFSQNDWNGAFQNSDIKKKIAEARNTYDVTVSFLEDDTFFDRDPDAFKDMHLFTLAAHGSPDGSQLGYGTDESYYLDKSDASFCQALTYLPSDAVIFLFSCSTASGGAGADNFANYVVTCAPGRKLIASTESFASNDFTIDTMSPFSVTITVEDTYPYNKDPLTNTPIKTDATYRVTTQPQQVVITKIEP